MHDIIYANKCKHIPTYTSTSMPTTTQTKHLNQHLRQHLVRYHIHRYLTNSYKIMAFFLNLLDFKHLVYRVVLPFRFGIYTIDNFEKQPLAPSSAFLQDAKS